VGVRASASALLSYDLTVVATDVRDVVAGAGGWLYDRVRAGWKVTVVIPASSDARPLEVLGVRTAVLAELGYSADDIADLRRTAVIA
jgi:hypothetical protein